MPQRVTITDTIVNSQGIAPNGAVMAGRRWIVKPTLPSPNDLTTQAAAFIQSNKDKSANVAVWRNVKYGQDPVGDLRFKPARLYDYPSGTYDAQGPTPPPYQRYVDELGKDGRYNLGFPDVGVYDWIGSNTKETEGCLNLAIFAPEGLSNRPVCFHIHGGGWGVYHVEGPHQLGHYMAAHMGCVVVLVEYRLSTFGHFPHPAIIEDNEPSVAYTDIKKALEWVNTNIAAFGGDPTKVCVSGSSAGGAAGLLIMEDDEVQAWFNSAFIGSGGGLSPYPTESFYTPRMLIFEKAIISASPFLPSMHLDYPMVSHAIADRGFTWAIQHAVYPHHIQALADARDIPTTQSIMSAMEGTVDTLELESVPTDNVFPFKRNNYVNAIEAAKDGKFRKPFVSLFAECEAVNLLGEDYVSIRDALLNMSEDTLNNLAQRLGYIDYDQWKNGNWMPNNGLDSLTSAQFQTNYDAEAIDCENRRVLYTHAVFGYPAWRIARGAAETASASAYLMVNNFSANSIWAGHSQEVPLIMGNIEWIVSGKKEFPNAVVPGGYVNNHMDGIYVSELMMNIYAKLAATGDPNGAYSYNGFDLFSDTNTHPDLVIGGSFTATPVAFSVVDQGKANIIGKTTGDPIDNLNAGTFVNSDIEQGLDLTRDAKMTYDVYMSAAFEEYLSLLEP